MKAIGQLEEAAESSTRFGSERMFDLYEHALKICNSHNFLHRAAKIHCKRAKLALNTKDFGTAMREADKSIETDPDYLEVLCSMIIIDQHSKIITNARLNSLCHIYYDIY